MVLCRRLRLRRRLRGGGPDCGGGGERLCDLAVGFDYYIYCIVARGQFYSGHERGVADAATDPKFAEDREDSGLSGSGEFEAGSSTFPNGCYVCEVEIDRDTGSLEIVKFIAFDDVGTVVNPLLAGGQVAGGIIQGIGQAVHEGCIYDAESGQLLTGSYTDYRMPRADDVPALDMNFIEDFPCTTNPMGIKGAGEVGSIGAPPAVVNAVLNALSEFSVSAIDMPLTPENIWRQMQGNA